MAENAESRPSGRHLTKPGRPERFRTYFSMHENTRNAQLPRYNESTCPYSRAGALGSRKLPAPNTMKLDHSTIKPCNHPTKFQDSKP